MGAGSDRRLKLAAAISIRRGGAWPGGSAPTPTLTPLLLGAGVKDKVWSRKIKIPRAAHTQTCVYADILYSGSLFFAGRGGVFVLLGAPLRLSWTPAATHPVLSAAGKASGVITSLRHDWRDGSRDQRAAGVWRGGGRAMGARDLHVVFAIRMLARPGIG